MKIIWVDANPHVAALATDKEYSTLHYFLEERITNNEAEYLAVLFALKTIKEDIDFEIRSDSRLVVNQLNRKWHVKKKRLRQLANQIWNLVHERKLRGYSTTFVWVSRKENIAGKMLP